MDVIELFLTVATLKDIKRTGWVNRGVSDPESVADHTFGTALLSLLLPVPADVDRELLVKMAILHDLGESLIGDIVCEEHTIINSAKMEQKKKDETSAIKSLLHDREELQEIALDYMYQRSSTARYLKELDKLEMVLQAFFYETHRDDNVSLQEFWDSSQKYLKTPSIIELFQSLKDRRL